MDEEDGQDEMGWWVVEIAGEAAGREFAGRRRSRTNNIDLT